MRTFLLVLILSEIAGAQTSTHPPCVVALDAQGYITVSWDGPILLLSDDRPASYVWKSEDLPRLPFLVTKSKAASCAVSLPSNAQGRESIRGEEIEIHAAAGTPRVNFIPVGDDNDRNAPDRIRQVEVAKYLPAVAGELRSFQNFFVPACRGKVNYPAETFLVEIARLATGGEERFTTLLLSRNEAPSGTLVLYHETPSPELGLPEGAVFAFSFRESPSCE